MKIPGCFIGLLVFVTSCSDDEIPSGAALLNGEPFTASSVAAVISGNSLYLELTSDNSFLRFWVPLLKNGEFIVNNTLEGNICGTPTSENTVVFAEYIDQSGKVHFGISGTLSLSVIAGLASGSFSFYAESTDDSEVTVTKGNFQTVISKPPGCLLTSGGRLNEDEAQNVYYTYNHNGHLVGLSHSVGATRTHLYLSYADNRPVAIASRNNWCSTLTLLTYAGNRVAATANTTEYTFEYSDDLLTQYTYFGDQIMTLVYDENKNLIQSTLEAPYGTNTGLFGNYDNHPNPVALILSAVNQQQALLVLLHTRIYFIPHTGSTNNPRQMGLSTTIEYQYNDAGYPTMLMVKNTDGTPNGVPIFFTYTGCR